MSNPLGLDLEMVSLGLMWVLGPQTGSSGRAKPLLKHIKYYPLRKYQTLWKQFRDANFKSFSKQLQQQHKITKLNNSFSSLYLGLEE